MSTVKGTRIVYRMEADITRLRGQLGQAQAQLKRHAAQTKTIGKQVRTSMAGMFAGFTAFAAVGGAVRSLTGFEASMSKLKAISGATSKELAALNKNALELGRISKFTAGSIGEMEVVLARIGFTTDEILKSTDAVRKLATVADSELAPAAEVMGFTLRQFNLDAEESERVANVMAEGFSSTALTLERFQVSMSNVGATANAAGFSLEQTTAILGTLVSSGIEASKAGTDLRRIFIEMTKSGKSFEQVVLEIKAAEDKLAKAEGEVGARAMTSSIILSEQTGILEKLATQYGDTNLELDKQVSIMEDNLITDWKKFISAIDGVVQRGGAISDFFRTITQDATNLVNAINGVDGAFMGTEKSSTDLQNQLINTDIRFKLLDKVIRALNPGQESMINLMKQADEEAAELDAAFDALGDGVTQLAFDWDAAAAKIKKAKEVILLNPNAPTPIDNQFGQETGTGTINQFAGNLGTLIPDQSLQIPAFLNPDSKAYKEAAEEHKEFIRGFFGEIRSEAQSQVDLLNAIFNGAVVDAISSTVEILASGGGLKQVFEGLLGIIGEGLVDMGKALISMGVMLQAFKAAPPPAKIAIGIAAVALGTIFKGAAGRMASSVGGAHGGGSGGGFQGNQTGQSIQVGGEFVVRGTDLVYIIENLNRRDTRGKANF